MSVSYKAVLECEPEMSDGRLATKVDLQILKDMMDRTYVTHRSLLMKREVDFRERSGELRRMRLENHPVRGVTKFTAEWRTVKPDGDTVPWDDPALKRHPTLTEVYHVIAKGVTERDETITHEFKLKGVKLITRKDHRRWLELKLEHEDGNRSLRCQENADLGTICTCTKK